MRMPPPLLLLETPPASGSMGAAFRAALGPTSLFLTMFNAALPPIWMPGPEFPDIWFELILRSPPITLPDAEPDRNRALAPLGTWLVPVALTPIRFRATRLACGWLGSVRLIHTPKVWFPEMVFCRIWFACAN